MIKLNNLSFYSKILQKYIQRLTKENRNQEAIKVFDEGIKKYPNFSDLFFGMGNALIISYINQQTLQNLQRYDEALKFYDKSIKINPKNSEYFCNKAKALSSQLNLKQIDNLHRYEEAFDCFEMSINLNPRNSTYYYEKAWALRMSQKKLLQQSYINLKKHQIYVIMQFIQALKIVTIIVRKQMLYLRKSKQILLHGLNRFQEALQYYDYAIQLNPQADWFYFNKGKNVEQYQSQYFTHFQMIKNVIDKLNLYEEALVNYDLAIERDPKGAHYYSNKAMVLFIEQLIQQLSKLNRKKEALDNYGYAIQLNPEESILYYNKACELNYKIIYQSVIELNRYHEALEFYDLAIQKKPESSLYYDKKGKALIKG